MSQYTWKFRQINTLNYGSVNATHDVTAILNLGCPDSKAWYLKNETSLFEKVKNGRIRLHLKFWNKPVAGLTNGGIAAQYIDYRYPNRVRTLIHDIFADQKRLNGLTEEQVMPYLKTVYNLTKHDNLAINLTANEIAAAKITSLPSIIVDAELKPEESVELGAL
ncbi:MAG: thioredoxin domain-containing protein [Lentilactobacillus diolivorans]